VLLGVIGLIPPDGPASQQPQPGAGGYPAQPPGSGGGYRPSGYPQAPGGYRPYPGGSQPANPYLPVATTEVVIYDGYFYPPSIQVAPGATIRWTNKGLHRHTVTDLTGLWTSPELAPNDSWSFTLRHPLNHYYYCRHHRLTMSATIVVK